MVKVKNNKPLLVNFFINLKMLILYTLNFFFQLPRLIKSNKNTK